MSLLILATANLGKVQEFATLLTPLGWNVQPQSVWAVPKCPEPHATFIENALAKARHAAQHTGLPALADDSGLCVKALGGAPGIHSARYAAHNETTLKDDAANNTKLLHTLHELPNLNQRQAYFTCVLVAVKSPTDPEPLIAIGRWHGFITTQLNTQDSNGFGYDPLFICQQSQRSAASLTKAEKSAISHRGLAVAHMLQLIQSTW
jgi:XTP/dITP diphosphohydrolase